MMDSLDPGHSVSVITIDGPTASGKGTIAQRVAGQLGWHYLDSGALYRLVGVAANWRGLFGRDSQSPSASLRAIDEPAIADIARRLNCRFDNDLVFLEGQDVTLEIRSESASRWASLVGAVPIVRAALLDRQREFRQEPGLVADGRDMGTVVFPDARVKIYLTASVESRAQRRYNQLIEKGIPANMEGLLADLQARDKRDMNREVAPLRPAHDAVLLDSTLLDVDETVAAVLFHIL